MQRTVSARLSFMTAARTKLAMAVAVARHPGYASFEEELLITSGGERLEARELLDGLGCLFPVLVLE